MRKIALAGKNTTILFFVFIYIPSAALLLLSGASNLSNFVTTLFFLILSISALAVMAFMKSDDEYYQSLNLKNLTFAILVAVVMFFTSWGLSLSLKTDALYLSAVNSLSLTPMPSSVTMIVLSSFVSGLVLVATGEELFKLVMFAEGKERWGKGYGINRGVLFLVALSLAILFLYIGLNVFNLYSLFNMITLSVVATAIIGALLFVFSKKSTLPIPGVLVYVGFPVGFWAGLHGIQAYNNPVMIIPAFVNGVILIVYLWKKRCILGCIFAHWLYNGALQVIAYISGTANIASGTPLFPNLFDASYYANSGYILDILYLALFIGAIFFFLLPSLTTRNKK